MRAMLVYDDLLYDANGANWFAVTVTLVRHAGNGKLEASLLVGSKVN